MQLPSALLGLPASLLMLVATQLQAQQLPTAVKKMSLDEGEKILPRHLAFAPQYAPMQSPLERRGLLTPEDKLLLASNSSASLPFRPPFSIHYDGSTHDLRDDGALWRRAKEALYRLQGRQFACPQNTASCTSIGQPNYCCAIGETCFTVEDAPDAGNVGCCPDGQNCAGSVGSCGSGSTACSAEIGGGCCIPGFICAQIGCVASTVSVITLTTTSSTVVSSPSSSTQVTTVIVTTSPSPQPTTSTTTTTSTPTATSTTTGGQPPYRPTSGSGSSTTEAPSTTSTGDYCPTGFYACLATAGSGCCRTGRDCVTTSCPPVSSTTITSNGATIVVPASDVPSTDAQPTSTCATGWFLCGTDAGPVAGCCPSGYDCGTASCTLNAATATATVQKELPSAGHRGRANMGIWGLVLGLSGLTVGLMI
ncbi:hypothetical protein BJ170DRAFT_591147 [Xylariales sp. AK1849]|nr:hypothetical protein BJ170DRAFT_591147 [Xylariales sp. AK1849]